MSVVPFNASESIVRGRTEDLSVAEAVTDVVLCASFIFCTTDSSFADTPVAIICVLMGLSVQSRGITAGLCSTACVPASPDVFSCT